MNYRLITIFLLLFSFNAFPSITEAHRSGCHRWHSCPSDSGSYSCGDAGHPCQYPTYPASGGVIYPPSGYYKDCYDCELKKVPTNSYTSGMGWSCNSGYKKVGETCEKIIAPSSAYSASVYSANAPSSSCPLNSHTNPSDSTKCLCDTGFQVNVTKDTCVVAPVISNNQACINAYGINSNWDGTKTSDGRLNCGCQSGYGWDSFKTSCVPLPSQSQGEDTISSTITCSQNTWSVKNICNAGYNPVCTMGGGVQCEPTKALTDLQRQVAALQKQLSDLLAKRNY